MAPVANSARQTSALFYPRHASSEVRNPIPTINIDANISVETLVKAAEQLSTPDLQKFRSQVLAMTARRAASNVPQDEAQCLLQINQRLAPGLQEQYEELIGRCEAETLTAEQHAMLLQLSQQAEAIDVQRLEALTKLSRLRGVTLAELLRQLQIDKPAESVALSTNGEFMEIVAQARREFAEGKTVSLQAMKKEFGL
jgi:hypothetical protein